MDYDDDLNYATTTRKEAERNRRILSIVSCVYIVFLLYFVVTFNFKALGISIFIPTLFYLACLFIAYFETYCRRL